jgi:hypothetical protein
MSDEFFVEGRYFPNSLYAFTFAQIQADRMDRPVHVVAGDPEWATHRDQYGRVLTTPGKSTNWHATAHPENFRREHLVRVDG